METNIYQSDLAIHPGEYLDEILEDINMTQVELSKRLGRPMQAINEIIKGKKSITSLTALELEDVLGVPSYVWMGWESEYQITIAKQEELKQMEEESYLVKNFPYLDLVNYEFVKPTKKRVEKVDELKRFFGVAKLSQIEHVKVYQPAFRVSNHNNVSHEAIASWIQASIIKAKEINTEEFNRDKLNNGLHQIKNLMNLENIKESILEIKNILASCGIAFVLLPHFKNTKIHGATFWVNDNKKAVVAMTIRGGYSDIFWFSLFHELGHILLHPKRKMFLEDDCSDLNLQKQEDEADDFAKKLLISEKDFKLFKNLNNLTRSSIVQFAEEQNIKPSIVVGRLMYEKIIKFNDYKLITLRDKYIWDRNK